MLPPTVDWEVLTRYLAGETTEEENREVELWEASSAANRRQLSQLRKIWQASGTQTEAPETNVDLALQEITRKLNFNPSEHTLPKPEVKSDYSWVWKVAAVLVVTLGIVLTVFRNKNAVQDLGVAYVKYETKTGEQTKITLPDNSTVWLNGGSSLRYPKTFATNSREIQLTGEAFFDVAKDANKPFRITAAETVTEVKGTSFNVEAYAEQKAVIVSVVTGKVELREEDKPENSVLLTPNQTGKFNSETHNVNAAPTSDPNFMAWQTRVLRFQNTDLKTVAHDLEKVYGKEFRFRNEKLQECHFTGTFEKQTLEEIQEVLHLTLNLTFSEENHTVWIDGKGC